MIRRPPSAIPLQQSDVDELEGYLTSTRRAMHEANAAGQAQTTTTASVSEGDSKGKGKGKSGSGSGNSAANTKATTQTSAKGSTSGHPAAGAGQGEIAGQHEDAARQRRAGMTREQRIGL